MSYKKILIAFACVAAFAAGVAFEQEFDSLPSSQEIPAVEPGANGPDGVNHGDPGPFPEKDWKDDPYAQGNAPQGGGPNEDAGPGTYQAMPEYPPSTPRINPAPPSMPIEPMGPGAPYDDPKPLMCSKITYAGHNVNWTVTFIVPEGWSVWRCIEERFGFVADRQLMEHINYLQRKIDEDLTLKVRNANKIPVGYMFVMGIGGGGPDPIES